MIALALLGGEAHAGVAPHYSPGLMGKVASRRGLQPEPCMVSSPRYEIGEHVYVYGVRTKVLRYCLVADVSAPQHRAGHLRRGIETELNYEVTKELCGSTREPSRSCPVIVYRLNDAE